MKIRQWIVMVLWLSSGTLWAMSTEQEQQFLYYFYAAHQAIEQEQYGQAFLLLDFCEQLNPTDGLTKNYLGILYDAIGQKDRAFSYFQQAYDDAPLDCWERYCDKLIQSENSKDHKTAVHILEKTSKQLPKDEEVWEALQHAYTKTSNWKKAIEIQDYIDQLAGYDTYSAMKRFRLYTAWGKPKEAMQAIDDYLVQDPREYRFLLFKGDVMVQHKQYVQAFILFVQIGDSLANLQEMDGAYLAYEKALELDQNNTYVLNNYAYMLATHDGDLKKAEWMSQKTIQAHPNNATFLDTYAWILHLQGLHSLAAFYIQKALENASSPEDARVIQEHARIIHEQ